VGDRERETDRDREGACVCVCVRARVCVRSHAVVPGLWCMRIHVCTSKSCLHRQRHLQKNNAAGQCSALRAAVFVRTCKRTGERMR
jgi:hypothetical protein